MKENGIFEIPRDIAQNRKLIVSLSKNDFKKKFAGSYFGIVWAFVQPIVTVVLYWFVFEKALNPGTLSTKDGINVPYILWLLAGLVPWFFFSEVINAGTNVLLEYNYLVQKVVFKISTLPVVKIISSLFVHVFFVVFTIVLLTCYGFTPSLYLLQIIYYSFAMIMLSLGIIYFTSAVVVFFRDLSQLINIVLQVGMWVTPIMWNFNGMEGRVPHILMEILKLNPFYYIVTGYRETLFDHVGFWNHPLLTLYFWLVVLLFLFIGGRVFTKLQDHFADVL